MENIDNEEIKEPAAKIESSTFLKKEEQKLMEVLNLVPKYDQCLVQFNLNAKDQTQKAVGTIIVKDILRIGVKIHDKQAKSDNEVVAQRDKGLVKYWLPTGKVVAGSILNAEETTVGVDSEITITYPTTTASK